VVHAFLAAFPSRFTCAPFPDTPVHAQDASHASSNAPWGGEGEGEGERGEGGSAEEQRDRRDGEGRGWGINGRWSRRMGEWTHLPPLPPPPPSPFLPSPIPCRYQRKVYRDTFLARLSSCEWQMAALNIIKTIRKLLFGKFGENGVLDVPTVTNGCYIRGTIIRAIWIRSFRLAFLCWLQLASRHFSMGPYEERARGKGAKPFAPRKKRQYLARNIRRWGVHSSFYRVTV
jgi:hypothetical protein